MKKVLLQPTKRHELQTISTYEAEQGTAEYVLSYSEEQHLKAFSAEHSHYLTIFHDDQMCGFIIYVREEKHAIELRRIVVSKKGEGLGTLALQAFEKFCATSCGAARIWLDVFERNARARHVYRKHGFNEFGVSEHSGARLVLMEKYLSHPAPLDPNTNGANNPKCT